ncbi:MAG: LacI family DNA-binding transcriptional regulator, partial [Cytophagales bacterium]|nr:LacI family DNA-binding transcriptional regulator [Armatimonadota bacterium]
MDSRLSEEGGGDRSKAACRLEEAAGTTIGSDVDGSADSDDEDDKPEASGRYSHAEPGTSHAETLGREEVSGLLMRSPSRSFRHARPSAAILPVAVSATAAAAKPPLAGRTVGVCLAASLAAWQDDQGETESRRGPTGGRAASVFSTSSGTEGTESARGGSARNGSQPVEAAGGSRAWVPVHAYATHLSRAEKILKGIRTAADDADLRVRIYPGADLSSYRAIESFLGKAVDGLILGFLPAPTLLSALRRAQIPVTILPAQGTDTPLPPGCTSVLASEADVVHLALSHLWDLGHRKIALLPSPYETIFTNWCLGRGIFDPTRILASERHDNGPSLPGMDP